MSGMDRLTDDLLEAYAAGKWKSYERDNIAMARELLAHRRASQSAPAPVAWRYPYRGSWEYSNSSVRPNRYEEEPLYAAPAPSDRLREAALAVEQWWLTEGMYAFNGAPNAMFRLRAALSASPAQEGGE